MAAPERPVSRPDPTRPQNPSRPEGAGMTWWGLVALFAVILVGGVAMFAALAHPRHEDTREVRHIGELSCVYNVTRDRIEACR